MWGNLFRGGIIVGRQPKSASLAMFCVCLGRIFIFLFEAALPLPSLGLHTHTHTHTQYLLVFWLSGVWVGFCGLCCQKWHCCLWGQKLSTQIQLVSGGFKAFRCNIQSKVEQHKKTPLGRSLCGDTFDDIEHEPQGLFYTEFGFPPRNGVSRTWTCDLPLSGRILFEFQLSYGTVHPYPWTFI